MCKNNNIDIIENMVSETARLIIDTEYIIERNGQEYRSFYLSTSSWYNNSNNRSFCLPGSFSSTSGPYCAIFSLNLPSASCFSMHYRRYWLICLSWSGVASAVILCWF